MASYSEAAARLPRSGPDKVSFLFIFIIGAAGIVSLKTYYGLDQIYVIAWPIVWMLFYMLVVTMLDRYRLREDQAGDNLYYLGFLYTLTSLSVALYYFTDGEQALEHIISNFGIALATTILGVALRVFLHQMREDPVDTEREARLGLAEAVTKLRGELDVSVQEMNSFSRQTRQSVEEALHELGEAANRMLGKSSEEVSAVVERATKGIEEAFASYGQQAKSLTAASQRQVQATEKLIERTNAIEVPKDLIERKIAPAAERLARLAEDIERRERLDDEAVRQLAQSVVTTNRMVAEAQHILLGMRRHMEAAAEFGEKIEGIVGRLGGADAALGAAVASVTRLGELEAQAADSQTATLRERSAALQEMRQAMAGHLEEFRAALRQQTEMSAEETLEAMRGLARRQGEAYEALARQAQETLAELQSTREASEREVMLARRATEEVMKQLAAMVQTLGAQLAGDRPQDG